MAINRLQPVAVIYDDGIAVNAEIPRVEDSSAIRCRDGSLFGHGDVIPEVILAVDLPSLVDIGSSIREGCHHFPVPHHDERTVPQKCGLRFLRQFADRQAVFLAQFPVYGEVVLQRVAAVGDFGRLRQNFRHDFVYKAIADLQVVRPERLRKKLVYKALLRRIPGGILDNDAGIGLRHIVRHGE